VIPFEAKPGETIHAALRRALEFAKSKNERVEFCINLRDSYADPTDTLPDVLARYSNAGR
jgi:sugar/nucleoside kinase (ribokinase family)